MLSLTGLLALVPCSNAQVTSGQQYLSFNVGYASGKLASTGTQVDGGGFRFAYERVLGNAPVSVVATFSYTLIEDQNADPLGIYKRAARIYPLGLGARLWLGKRRFQAYGGGLLAVYFSWLETRLMSDNTTYSVEPASGWGTSVPLGLSYSVSEQIVLNLEYTLSWLWSADALENKLLHLLGAGVGFRF
jgi:hypothetical protein